MSINKNSQKVLTDFLLNIAPRIFILFSSLVLGGVLWLFIAFVLNGGAGGSSSLNEGAILFSVIYALVFFVFFAWMVRKLFPTRERTEEVVSIVENSVPLEESLKWVNIIYALQAMSIFLMPAMLLAGFICFYKKNNVSETWLETHFKWQMQTFWRSIVLMMIAGLLLQLKFMLGLGYLIYIINAVWIVYRINKGFRSLNEYKEVF